jgi:hypothetical protein
MMWIMEDVFLSSVEWIKKYSKRAISFGVTHVIMEEKFMSQSIRDKFDVLEVPSLSEFVI